MLIGDDRMKDAMQGRVVTIPKGTPRAVLSLSNRTPHPLLHEEYKRTARRTHKEDDLWSLVYLQRSKIPWLAFHDETGTMRAVPLDKIDFPLSSEEIFGEIRSALHAGAVSTALRWVYFLTDGSYLERAGQYIYDWLGGEIPDPVLYFRGWGQFRYMDDKRKTIHCPMLPFRHTVFFGASHICPSFDEETLRRLDRVRVIKFDRRVKHGPEVLLHRVFGREHVETQINGVLYYINP